LVIFKATSLLTEVEQRYAELKRNKWLRYFAIFCRISLALGFIPSGIVKVMGERFTGLPAYHPLGHYFDALHLTGYYYTFIGVGQLIAALLLLIPRTALLGAIIYFPIILNICVLAHAVRFEGTRISTLMLLANLFLLVWDYPRLKYILPFGRHDGDHPAVETSKFPVLFFACVFALAVSVIVINIFLFDIRPGNSQIECTNSCKNSGSLNACQHFCDCIYTQGNTLNVCLNGFHAEKDLNANPAGKR
jgi:uncharacterized membrane protein YphA (DoxX/SURF4 family)